MPTHHGGHVSRLPDKFVRAASLISLLQATIKDIGSEIKTLDDQAARIYALDRWRDLLLTLADLAIDADDILTK